MTKIIVQHQLHQSDFYLPKWKVKYLFIGTFNPTGGESVNYYYGRSRNRTWELLSILFKIELNPQMPEKFFDALSKKGIACMDIIDSVEINSEDYDYVIGKGYKDSKIINNKVKRNYNTSNINNIIQQNEGVKVYSTWGTGSNLLSWKEEVKKIDSIIPLASPSMAARVPKGAKKFEYMIENWRNNIELQNEG